MEAQVNCMTILYLLGDVPDESGHIESYQPVVDGHFVKRCPFFVAKERVWDPDLVPVIFADANIENFGMNWLEPEPPIAPRLPQVHADGVVLHTVSSPLIHCGPKCHLFYFLLRDSTNVDRSQAAR